MDKVNEPANEMKWGGLLNEFLWTCAGVNKKILRQCRADYAKYAGMGGTILFTALMAMFSGGYAMYFVFANPDIEKLSTDHIDGHAQLMAICFGIFWGLLIFNLDRFIVNTMYSDGKHTISKDEIIGGLPRIIMAIFLGIVISTPLEMKIFEDRIDHQLVIDNIKRANDARKESELGNKSFIERRNELEKERKEISKRLAKANYELQQEAEGTALSGKVGHGPIYEDKKANRDAIQKEMDDWTSAHQTELTDIKQQISANASNAGANISKASEENGFCVRYEAFSNVKSENFSLQLVSIFVMLLFIIIETTPTFFKMMIASGPYDDLLRSEMHRVRVLSDQQISDLNDNVNTEVKISTEKNHSRLEAEMAANKELLNQIATVQAELLTTAIAKWREEELTKIEKNPSQYIQTGTATNQPKS
ncbi:DUF4407 domain-containing protein [Prevotella melaninogenica]|uniref:DUF4407 domain-containing protein n=1 Tax=Prevotella melaninogenica TaxID=28132 RepID=UPI001BACA878|nr:DUF4407 domain-containing protein [Prevotella melaninogenica]QUB60855.1 DUF4407 domain-containing protein [Prevotella melaninogenica]